MQAVERFTYALLIAIVALFGAFALAACTDDAPQAQSASEQAQDAASAGADDEQDNCYGDDLPAVKK